MPFPTFAGRRPLVFLFVYVALLGATSCNGCKSKPAASPPPPSGGPISGPHAYQFPGLKLYIELERDTRGTVVAGTLPPGAFSSASLAPARDATLQRGGVYGHGEQQAVAFRWAAAGASTAAREWLDHEVAVITAADKSVVTGLEGDTRSRASGHEAVWKQYTFDDATGKKMTVRVAAWYCDVSKRFVSLWIRAENPNLAAENLQRYLDAAECHGARADME